MNEMQLLVIAIVAPLMAVAIGIGCVLGEIENRKTRRRVSEINERWWAEDDRAGRPRRPGLTVQ